MSERTVRIGGAAGFWGDTSIAAPQLVRAGVDYLVFDYLAEITMSILARAKAKDPNAGYATDFATVVMPMIVREAAERGTKIVANAGGVNPAACRDAVLAAAEKAGVALKVAVVDGDDLMSVADDLRAAGAREMYTGDPLPERLMSMNAYLGAGPIAAALGAGADVVITGRCVDSALVLGPLMHEFGWEADDWDRLAQGSLAGHVIECGAQATGGLFTDWEQVPRWEDIGYPIAECRADGSFDVTKPDDTGGLVTPATVAEQVLYEIGDPGAYMLPDVTCDFRQVTIDEKGENRVALTGAKGRPPADSYKVSATWLDGYRANALLMIGGIDADRKARRVAEAILTRTRRIFAARNVGDYRRTSVEVLGAEDSYGPHARIHRPREVILKIAAHHDDRTALETLAREVAPSATSMSPGITGMGGGRPKVTPVVRLFSLLVPKDRVDAVVRLGDEAIPVAPPPGEAEVPPAEPLEPGPAEAAAGDTVAVPLVAIAHGRSGDKGDSANIGIRARKAEYLPLLRAALTEDAVAAWFAHILKGTVTRWELPGIDAFNFLLTEVLDGGGIASLRHDPQGKAYAQMLLDMPVQVPADWARRDRLEVLEDAA